MECLQELDKRLTDVLKRIGDTTGAENLVVKSYVLCKELQSLYGAGVICTESFWHLWEVYSQTEGRDSCREQEVKLMACIDSFELILAELRAFELVYKEDVDSALSCGLIDTDAEHQVVSANISRIPALFSGISVLIAKSIGLSRRFLDLNNQKNEFWSSVEIRLRDLQHKIYTVEDSLTI